MSKPVFNSRTEKSRDDWETPPILARKIVDKFSIEWDMACSTDNRIVAKGFTKEHSALNVDWYSLKGNLFCNPPFVAKEDFLAKMETPQHRTRNTTVFLLPNNARGTKWWFRYVALRADEVINLIGRVNYCLDKKPIKPGANFDSCLVVYRPHYVLDHHLTGFPKETYWDWRA